MAIRVFIKRICEDPSKEKELFSLVRKLRSLVPSNPAISQANMLRKPITQKISLPSALGILQKIGRTGMKVKNGGKFSPK